MFVKLTVLTCSLAAASAVYNGPLAGGKPADLYPAGVSPQACPNFPNCANPAVAADPGSPQPQQWGGQPQWGNQQWAGNNQWNQGSQWNGNNQWNQGNQWNNAPAVPQGANWDPASQTPLDRGEYIGDGDYHGEGLYEALAEGYENRGGGWNNNNQWNQGGNWNQQAAWNSAPQVGVPAQIPAGVDAGACPNYPFCH